MVGGERGGGEGGRERRKGGVFFIHYIFVNLSNKELFGFFNSSVVHLLFQASSQPTMMQIFS